MTTTNSPTDPGPITLTATCWHTDRGTTRDELTEQARTHFGGRVFHQGGVRSLSHGSWHTVTIEFRPGQAFPPGFVPGSAD